MTRLLVAVVVGVAALTGCGGGDDGGGGSGDAPSREQFVADANAICREGEQKVDAATGRGEEELRQAGSDEERRRVVGDLLESTAEEYSPYLDRLRDLQPPDDLAEEWSDFVARISEAFDLIPELADATRENDEQQLSELTTEFTEIAGQTRPFAERTGLDDCLPDEGTQ
jgi:hypothetical protein